MQLEKTELGSDGIPAKTLEGASTGSGVGLLVISLELGLCGASLGLDLAAIS